MHCFDVIWSFSMAKDQTGKTPLCTKDSLAHGGIFVFRTRTHINSCVHPFFRPAFVPQPTCSASKSYPTIQWLQRLFLLVRRNPAKLLPEEELRKKTLH